MVSSGLLMEPKIALKMDAFESLYSQLRRRRETGARCEPVTAPIFIHLVDITSKINAGWIDVITGVEHVYVYIFEVLE